MQDLIASSLSSTSLQSVPVRRNGGVVVSACPGGVYSVIAYSVRRRVHEIGIRTALGADPWDVLRLIVSEGMTPALIGVAVGIVGAYTLSGVLSHLIFGVSPTDPWTFGAVASLLSLVALIACMIPAYRATRVEPLTALRN